MFFVINTLVRCRSLKNTCNKSYFTDVFQETLKELFPSREVLRFRYRQVVIFVAGLMKDSRPLVQHVYEMQVEDYLDEMRTGDNPYIDVDLFKWLHA